METPAARSTLALPWLGLDFPGLTPPLWAQIERAAVKFARATAAGPLHLTVTVTLADAHAAPAVEQPNARFQFVDGVEGAASARYVTAEGAEARIDHERGLLEFALTPAVFDAPYSTWPDLFAAPLSAHWRAHGYFPLHAAAVSFGRDAALIIGESGAGKTTMALALTEDEGRWRADDKVLLDTHAGHVTGVSLYRNTNLAPETIAHHARLSFALDRPPINDTNDKRPLHLAEAHGAVDLSPFVPTLLLFPRQVPAQTSTLRPLSQVEALMRLAAQSPTYGWAPRLRRQQSVLAALAAQATAWEVQAGLDVLGQPARFAALVRQQVSAALSVSQQA